MKSDSIFNVTQAQAKFSKLIKRDSFAIANHGKVVGFYLSKDRVEALVESMELMGNPDFVQALKEHKSGKGKTYDVADLDAEMAA